MFSVDIGIYSCGHCAGNVVNICSRELHPYLFLFNVAKCCPLPLFVLLFTHSLILPNVLYALGQGQVIFLLLIVPSPLDVGLAQRTLWGQIFLNLFANGNYCLVCTKGASGMSIFLLRLVCRWGKPHLSIPGLVPKGHKGWNQAGPKGHQQEVRVRRTSTYKYHIAILFALQMEQAPCEHARLGRPPP